MEPLILLRLHPVLLIEYSHADCFQWSEPVRFTVMAMWAEVPVIRGITRPAEAACIVDVIAEPGVDTGMKWKSKLGLVSGADQVVSLAQIALKSPSVLRDEGWTGVPATSATYKNSEVFSGSITGTHSGFLYHLPRSCPATLNSIRGSTQKGTRCEFCGSAAWHSPRWSEFRPNQHAQELMMTPTPD